MSDNPNNCKTCDYKKMEQEGWCYMFKDEPTKVCMIHTGRLKDFFDFKDTQDVLDEILISTMPDK